MKVKDLMTKGVEYIAPSEMLIQAAKMMSSHDIGSIPVYQGDKLYGMITDRDIVIRAIAMGKNPNTTPVSEILTSKVIFAAPEDDVHDAADTMALHKVRRLPILEEGKLVGIISLGDFAVERYYVNEAGEALSEISEGAHH